MTNKGRTRMEKNLDGVPNGCHHLSESVCGNVRQSDLPQREKKQGQLGAMSRRDRQLGACRTEEAQRSYKALERTSTIPK